MARVVDFNDVHGYQSYKGVPVFRKAISNWMYKIYGVKFNSESEVLPLIGSKEGINIIMQSFVNKGDEVLVPDLGYPTYRSVANLVEAKVKIYSVDLDVYEIKKSISDKTKMIWLNYPHMPTGEQPNPKSLKALVDLAIEKNILIVNDNPYSTILTDKYFSIFQIEGAKSVCLELNSLSKSHNMAGWRVGMVCGKSEFISNIYLSIDFGPSKRNGFEKYLAISISAKTTLFPNKSKSKITSALSTTI